MYLGSKRISEQLRKSVSVVVNLRNVASESSYDSFVESYELIVCLWVICCRRKVSDIENAGQCCNQKGLEQRALVCKKEQRNTVRHDSLIEEDLCSMSRSRL